MKKKIIIFIIFFFIIALFFFYLKKINMQEATKIRIKAPESETYSSNIIKDVYYSSKDAKGNEYIIQASKGEIDYSQVNIIYLTNVKGFIKLKNSNNIEITSEYGKYNSENFDTIFSKNVTINYLDNKISGEYLDFSIKRDSMIISRNVVYTNLENILKADVMEINISNKNTKIFMFKDNKKVNIRSKE
jgi:hypothetical protein